MMRACFALMAAMAFALPAPAWAESTWGDGVEVMSDLDLDSHRGGFRVEGMDIHFGAVVTTYVGGVAALTTQLTWSDAGQLVERTVGGLGRDISTMTPEQLSTLGLEGLSGADGVIINDDSGVTALIHSVTDGSLQNIIINNANDRDLSQEIDVTLEMPGFEALQNSLLIEHFGIKLTDEMRSTGFGATS